MSAATGADLRSRFQGEWGFPINDQFYDAVYPAVERLVSQRDPAAYAGEDRVVALGDTVTLDDAYVFDWENDPLSLLWEVRTTPPGATAELFGANLLNPSFRADQAGLYVLSLTASDGLLTGAPDTVEITVEAKPQISSVGIVNAASFESRGLSPGEIVSLFGSALGPPLPGAAGIIEDGERWSTEAAGVKVYFDGTPGAVVFVREDQLNAVVPYDVEGKGQVKVEVEYRGLLSNAVTMSVVSAAPGIFTSDGSGFGQAAALNEDSSFNTSLRPAGQQTIVAFSVTGEGRTNPAGEDGKLALDVFPKPIQPVRVLVDGREAEVLYAGAAPTFVAGLMQVNARLPEGVGSGSVSLVVEVGGIASQMGVTIAVE